MWKEKTWKQTLDHEGEPVLSLSMTLPLPVGEGRADRKIARFYERTGELWKARWTGVLYARACDALADAREYSRPFQCWEAALTHQLPYETAETASICLDVTELRDSSRPLTVRSAETWDLSTGTPLPLSHFLPRSPHWRRAAVEEVQRQALERLQGGESLFYEDVEERVAAHFSPRHFYLTGDGPVVFYPMWSLGSPAEGIPVFLLPAGEPEKISPQKKSEKT